MEHGYRVGSQTDESNINTIDLRRTHAGGQLEVRRSVRHSPVSISRTKLKTCFSDCKFSLGATPHVVHMTVKPQDFIDDEEAGKGGSRDREGSERSPRCRCCVIM